MRDNTKGSSCANWNMASVPEVMYAMVAAVTEEMSNGNREDMVRSSMMTSMVKTKPAMGALKIPATAPSAPHPTKSINVRWSMRKVEPSVEPMADPVSTIGASAPTDPPNPIVMELAMMLLQVLCFLICPSLREMAYRILVTP